MKMNIENKKTVKERIEEKLSNEKKKEGEKKLEALLREINDARAIVEAKEDQAQDIIHEYGLD